METLSDALQLEHTTFVHDRAETFGQRKDVRESFDLVTARAVARLSVLSELCLPLAKKNGIFAALKAAAADEELKAGQKAIKVLGGELEQVHSFTLPVEESERNIMIIRKTKSTPKNIRENRVLQINRQLKGNLDSLM